ncbi:MAG: PIN domain-containing protein [Betaproteobacteria bacterium]|nr:PIN domain-containing protein [Betaproteobacteria bacterium]
MISLDTHVLVRYLLNDDAGQGKAASAILAGASTVTAPVSVLLELAWVLEANDCTRDEIAKGFRHILGLPNFVIREVEALGYALRWFEGGMDFADALHLALSAKDEQFATLDRGLERRAKKLGAFPPVALHTSK